MRGKGKIALSLRLVLLSAGVMIAGGAKCKDPPQEAIGGIVLAIRTVPADEPPTLAAIHKISIEDLQIDVVYSASPEGEQQVLTIDGTGVNPDRRERGLDLVPDALVVLHTVIAYAGRTLLSNTAIRMCRSPTRPF